MSRTKIQVVGPDGKYRGGLFKDGSSNEHRWHGTVTPNLTESMVCSPGLETGSWYLIEYVTPRQITGSASNDSLFDELSTCRQQTIAQALHWFQRQAFGPPPTLVERVRAFATDWRKFCACQGAQALLHKIADQYSVPESGPILAGASSEDLELLGRLGLAYANRAGSNVGFEASYLVREMTVKDYMAWTDEQLAKVHTWIAQGEPADGPTAAMIKLGPLSGIDTSTAQRPRAPKRAQKAIDYAGYDMLCTAWDEQDPEHRRMPSWAELAEAVHAHLELKTKVKSTLTALKQRSPRTRAKRCEIESEIERERLRRGR